MEPVDHSIGPIFSSREGGLSRSVPVIPVRLRALGSSGGRGATSSQGEERQDDAQLIDAGGLVYGPHAGRGPRPTRTNLVGHRDEVLTVAALELSSLQE